MLDTVAISDTLLHKYQDYLHLMETSLCTIIKEYQGDHSKVKPIGIRLKDITQTLQDLDKDLRKISRDGSVPSDYREEYTQTMVGIGDLIKTMDLLRTKLTDYTKKELNRINIDNSREDNTKGEFWN